ncbi:MAG: helix-turn-helix transcriptional regulator [Clostridia bacterium]|nr:helix-turn-helix transcriptional regulator [Clostridia bacterium]MBR0326541.1 helix-turn-helix transcriptional regulator [Clostridia bacterium]
MKLRCIGYNRGHNENFALSRPPRLIEYVMLVLRSRTFFVFGEEKIIAEKGGVMIFDKTTPHNFGAYGEAFLHDWVTFDMTEREREEAVSRGVRFDTVLYPDNSYVLSELIRTLQYEKYSAHKSSEDITALYLKVLLLRLSDGIERTQAPKKRYVDKLEALRTDIYSNPLKKRTVDRLAASMNVSSSYFQHIYKEHFGISPIADLVKSRMEYAEYLLGYTDYSVKMIADELGYPSDIQFIQQFKRFAGKAPGKYRTSLK